MLEVKEMAKEKGVYSRFHLFCESDLYSSCLWVLM